jgi:pilus assembly protein CpaC
MTVATLTGFVRQVGTMSGFARVRLSLTTVATLCCLMTFDASMSAAADGARDPNGFIQSVRDPNDNAQKIIVTVGRSVVVETSVPVTRVKAGGAEIVSVDVVTPKEIVITGLEYGSTQVFVWSESGQRFVLDIDVELDLSLLNSHIADIDPQSDAEAKSVRGSVLLIGTVSSTELAAQIEDFASLFAPQLQGGQSRIKNHLRVAGEQQVQIRVVVAEVNRSATRTLGFSAFLAGENFKDGFLVSQIGGNPINIGVPANVNVQGPIPFLTGQVGIAPESTLSLGFPDLQMQTFIEALNTNSLLRVLAEPTLVAVSGETATFLAGGEFPIPVPQSGAATGAITIEFKDFGVNLAFSPLVQAHQRIRLRIRPEFSTRDETRGLLTASGFVPALTTRRAETTVVVDSGATLAMAGLLQDEVRGIINSVPGIGEIPVLGSLFRSVDFQRSRTELVIFVTPEIVDAMHPNQVTQVPGGDLVEPNDLELFLLGALEGAGSADDPDSSEFDLGEAGLFRGYPLQPSEPDRLTLHGPWGYADIGESTGGR